MASFEKQPKPGKFTQKKDGLRQRMSGIVLEHLKIFQKYLCISMFRDAKENEKQKRPQIFTWCKMLLSNHSLQKLSRATSFQFLKTHSASITNRDFQSRMFPAQLPAVSPEKGRSERFTSSCERSYTVCNHGNSLPTNMMMRIVMTLNHAETCTFGLVGP